MRFDTLSQIEARFRTEAFPLLTPFTLPVPNENLTLQGQVYKLQHTDYFFPVQHPKQRVVLHFTAGNLRSDIQSLTQPGRHVSVAFVVARDGSVLNACLSGDLAKEIFEIGLTVIGTNNEIGDDKAIRFSEFFYRELGKRCTYQQAFEVGRLIVGSNEAAIDAEDDLLICLPPLAK